MATIFGFNWNLYAAHPDTVNSIFGQEILLSDNLYPADTTYCHLAIGIVFIVLGSLIDNIAGQSAIDVLYQSLHYQLAISLAILGTASSLTAQHMDALPPYAFSDNLSQAALYIHHQYIGIICMWRVTHGAIYLVRDDSSRYATAVLVCIMVSTSGPLQHGWHVCNLGLSSLAWTWLTLAFFILLYHFT